MKKQKKSDDLVSIKSMVNKKHIEFYDKTLSVLEFILDEYSREISRTDMDFLEMSKNSIAVMDFLISAITKVQKGQRIALGLDDEKNENIEPIINVVEGVAEDKI